jgi:hypothetical protein
MVLWVGEDEIIIKNQKTMNELVKLYENPATVIAQDKLLTFLNMEPPKAWVKEHPFIKGYKYLPIDKVEFLLKSIFRQYKIEVLKTGMLMNAIECTVRVHYLDPVTQQWLSHDGVGAMELQTKSGSGVLKLDMSNVNSGAVAMALPIAKSVAVKDACDHLGTIFGTNLNRKNALTFNLEDAPDPLQVRVNALIESATTAEDLEALKPHVKPESQLLFDNKWKTLSKSA